MQNIIEPPEREEGDGEKIVRSIGTASPQPRRARIAGPVDGQDLQEDMALEAS